MCGEGGGCYWNLIGKARHVVNHSTVHRADPTTKNYQAQNVNSAKADAEKKQKSLWFS